MLQNQEFALEQQRSYMVIEFVLVANLTSNLILLLVSVFSCCPI